MGATERLYRKRKLRNWVSRLLALFATVFALSFLFLILWTLVKNGAGVLSPQIYTMITPPPGSDGGLANAILGSLIMIVVASVLGIPIGILAGTYLSEFGQKSKLASMVRFVTGIMLSAPSVVIGFFVYQIWVVNIGHFSGWAGAMALVIILIPVVISTTENMLRLVPQNLREAAAALGAPKWKMALSVTLRSAKSGILTGALLGVARISGESAPLLFTALNNQFWSTDLTKPMANLPVTIFQFAMSPYEKWQRLAWAGALLITLGVLMINITARLVFRKRSVQN